MEDQKQAEQEEQKTEEKEKKAAPSGVTDMHRNLIRKMQVLGYASNEGGICNAVSIMAMQAILCDEVDAFNRRVDWIVNCPLGNFKEAVASLSPDERTSIFAFLDGLELIQRYDQHQELFTIDLYNTPENRIEILSLLASEKLEKAGTLVHLPFSAPNCIVTGKDLNACFETFKTAFQHAEKPCVLSLTISIAPGQQHAISAVYLPHQQSWLFTDANQYPVIQSIPNIEGVIEKVLKGISLIGGDAASPIEVGTFGINHPQYQGAASSWKKGYMLYDMVKKGDIKQVTLALSTLPKEAINYTALLFIAAQYGHAAVAETLLKFGANRDHVAKDGSTLIFFAAGGGNIKLVRDLLASGASVNQVNAEGRTPLFFAAENAQADPAVVQMLLAQGNAVNQRDQDGATPLMCAARAGNIKIFQALLQKGADFSLADHAGNTPLSIAAAHGQLHIVLDLLKTGAIMHPNLQGDTPLMSAARKNHTAVMEALLKKGPASMVQQVNNKGRTALFIAAANNAIDTVRVLLDRGAVIDQADTGGSTPLLYAAANGHTDVVTFLVTRGASIHHTNGEGETPLSCAVAQCHTDVVTFLLTRGAAINHANEQGETPLSIAVHNGEKEIIFALLKAEANVNTADKEGNTPLSIAVHNGGTDIVLVLLAKGADVHKVDQEGNTLLSLAVQKGDTDIVLALLGAKADVDQADSQGNTPLDIARAAGHAGIVDILELHSRAKAIQTSKSEERIVFSTLPEKLQRAVIAGKDFRSYDMRDANLQNADLSDADLTGVDVSGADFTNAYLHKTNFTEVRGLSDSKNLHHAIITAATYMNPRGVPSPSSRKNYAYLYDIANQRSLKEDMARRESKDTDKKFIQLFDTLLQQEIGKSDDWKLKARNLVGKITAMDYGISTRRAANTYASRAPESVIARVVARIEKQEAQQMQEKQSKAPPPVSPTRTANSVFSQVGAARAAENQSPQTTPAAADDTPIQTPDPNPGK